MDLSIKMNWLHLLSHAFQIYIHIDAAIGGLVFPFLDNKTKYFTNQYVQSVTVDPHKMGYVPLSAGVFLCRKGLQKHVEIPINYVEGKVDDTLTGCSLMGLSKL